MRGHANLALLIAIAGSATACSVKVDYGAGNYLCREDPMTCGPGFVCQSGACVLESSAVDGSVPPIDAGDPRRRL